MISLKGKTIIITGGSQGIGLAIALRYAAAGANIAIFSKDASENIENAVNQLTAAGGEPMALHTDVSDVDALKYGVAQTLDRFQSIDILVNNTSATCLGDIFLTTPEQFDLVMATSVRAAFFLAQACHPHLKKSSNPHIINISAPLTLDAYWFKDHMAFSVGKYGMSLCTLGMAETFKPDGIAVNSLWPKSTIATQTIKNHFLQKVYNSSRWPSIMGDAAYELVLRSSKKCTGNFFTDEELLKQAGVTDFSKYAVEPGTPLMQAFFLPPEQDQTRVAQELFL
jgi:citronellol/citronellal dehydrogenase